MNIDIPFWLSAATLISLLIYLIDKMLWAPQRLALGIEKRPFVIEQAYQLLPVFIIVLVIRSFLAQAFFVPSPSLMPSVYPGELLLVNQYRYGLRLPVSNKLIMNVDDPVRGDIAVFYWPVNPDIHFVKRIVGVPGDKISYVNKVLTINGKVANLSPIDLPSLPQTENGQTLKYFEEDLLGVKHKIQQVQERPSQDFYNLVVPAGQYFFMGDNRDDSDDSRYWGFVSRDQIIGKGVLILASWDSVKHRIRFERNWTYLTS